MQRGDQTGELTFFDVLQLIDQNHNGSVRRCGRLPTEFKNDAKIVVKVAFVGQKGYDGLVDMGYKKHLRVDHSKSEFSSRRVRGNHINGIEGFWGYAKSRLARFRGMHPHTFLFHLKECEFRFNHRGQNLYHVFLRLCRQHPLS